MFFFNRSFNPKLIEQYHEKMKNNELTIEDILDNEELIQEIKTNSSSVFIPFLSNEIFKKLIDYSIKMPEIDDNRTGHKFPFNSTEILCCDNGEITNIFLTENQVVIDDNINEKETNIDVDIDKLKKEEVDKEEEKKEENKEEEKNEEKKEEAKNKEKKKEENKEEEKKEEVINEEGKNEEKKEESKNEEEKNEEKKEEEKNEENKEEEKNKENKEEEIKEENKEEGKNEEKKEEEKKEMKEEEKKEVEEEGIIEENQSINNKNKENENDINNNIEQEEIINNKKITKIVYENLDYFLSFIKTTSVENEVLIGYFYKIFKHLIQTKGTIIISYLFKEKIDFLEQLIICLNKKAISECINLILTFNEKTEEDLTDLQFNFCEKLLQELNDNNPEIKIEYICETIKNAISKQYFFNFLMSEERLINLLFNGLYLKDEKKLCSVISLMIKINENILSNFDNLVTPNLIQEDPMSIFLSNNYNFDNDSIVINLNKLDSQKKMLTLLFKILKKNEFIFLSDLNLYQNLLFISTFGKEQERLGIKKLTKVEYFRTIIDIFVNSYAKGICKEEIEELILCAKNKKIFSMISDLYFKYEINNLYQTLYNQIMEIIANKNSPQILIEAFFNEILEQTHKNLFDSLIDNLLNNLNFQFTNNRKSFSSFFANNIQLITYIFKSENIYLTSIIPINLKVINEVFVYHIKNFFDQKLLYMDVTNFDFDVEIPTSNSTLEELVEEDIKIYNVYLNGGDYKKANMDKLLMLGSKKKDKENEEKKEDKLMELSFEDIGNEIIDINKIGNNGIVNINIKEKEDNNNDNIINFDMLEEKKDKEKTEDENDLKEENNIVKNNNNEEKENNKNNEKNENDNNNEGKKTIIINEEEEKKINVINTINDINSDNKKENDINLENKNENDTNSDIKKEIDINLDNNKDTNSDNKKETDSENKKENDINSDNKKENDSENKKENDTNSEIKKENDSENKKENDTNSDIKKENNVNKLEKKENDDDKNKNEIKDKNIENKSENEFKEDTKIEEINEIKINSQIEVKKENENIQDNKKENDNENIQDNKNENGKEENKNNKNTENQNQIKDEENNKKNIIENSEINNNENKEEKNNEGEKN